MKNTLLLVLGLTFALQATAQLEDFTNAPNIQATTLTGDQYDLYAQLDSGYTVIIDVMATWCPPCWSWHEAGYFEEVYEQYGPSGTDDLRMIMVEADSRTAEDLLRMAVDGGSAATTSLGDWTAGVTYPIMNADQVASDYDIAYYPTIYAVTPNRMVYEIGRDTDLTTYQAFAQAAPGLASGSPDGLLLLDATEAECGEDVEAKVRFQNFSTQPLNEVTLTAMIGGNTVATNTVTQTLAPYEILDLSVGTIDQALFADGSQDVTIEYTLAGDATDDNELVTNIGVDQAIGDELTLEFNTDYYPVETAWTLSDANGNTVLSDSYTGTASGGGANANQTFTYTFNPATTDVSCYEMTITDSYGDGMGYITALTDPVPGFRILDGAGEVAVEVNVYDDQTFDSSIDAGFQAAAITVSATAPVASSVSVFPNPVSAAGVLTVELGELNGAGDIEARLINTLGQTVHQFATSAPAGKLALELPAAIRGAHVLELRSEAGVSTVRLTVE